MLNAPVLRVLAALLGLGCAACLPPTVVNRPGDAGQRDAWASDRAGLDREEASDRWATDGLAADSRAADAWEPDTRAADAEQPDGWEPDAREPDAREPDARAADTRAADTLAADTWAADAWEPDAWEPDAWEPDGGGVSREILFGYAFSQDGIEEVKDHTSLVHVVADPEGDSDLEALQRAEQEGLRVALSTVPVYISLRCDEYFADRAAAEAAWHLYAMKIAPYAGVIEAFHVMDEPYWVCGDLQGMPRAQVARLLDELGAMVKEDFPEVKLLTVFGGFSVNEQLLPPAGYEWLSFDCYYYYDSCGDDVHGRRSIPEYLALLRQLKGSDQRLVLVPPAYGVVPAPLIKEMALRYYQLAVETPEVDAVVPFLWEADGLIGLPELPDVQPIFRDIGNVLSGVGACAAAPPARLEMVGATTLCGAPTARLVRGDDDLFLRIGAASPEVRLCIEALDAAPVGWCDDPMELERYVPLRQGGWFYSSRHGEWRAILTRFALEPQPVGRYRLQAFDPVTGQAAQTTFELVPQLWSARLAVQLSRSLDGPPEVGFLRGVDEIHWRIDNAAAGTTFACIRYVPTQPLDRCADPTSEAYLPLGPPDWSFDAATGTYRAVTTPAAQTEMLGGLYHVFISERQSGQLTAALARLDG